ncbi:hypothetical protein [Limosilactobacillus pontis]|uniref:L,D-transpeptidase n=1 Tax=Limosilactobacillus pontis TaxID=35787 RepID=A0ABU7SQN7_9LACO
MNNKQKQFILLTTAMFAVIVLIFNIHAYVDSSRFISGASRPSQVLNVNRLRHPNINKPSEHRHYPDLSKQGQLRLIMVPGLNRLYVLSGQRVVYIMHARTNIQRRALTSQGHHGQQVAHVNSDHTLAGRNWSALSHQCYIIAPATVDQDHVAKDWLKTVFAFPNSIQLSQPDAQWLQSLPKNTKIIIR